MRKKQDCRVGEKKEEKNVYAVSLIHLVAAGVVGK